jgi:SNF2 family DNA or RNA helicase
MYVSVPTQQLVIPARRDVANLVPNLKEFDKGGKRYQALPHTIEVVRLLRNLGMDAPSPIESYYDWAGDSPFESQRVTASLLSINRRAYVLNSMGTGKTRATLYAIDYLIQQGRITRALVVAPLSTLVATWQLEVFEKFQHMTTSVLYGDKAKRLKLLAREADLYIINHDGVNVLREELMRRTDIDCLVLDELAVYRNSRSQRWKVINPFVRRAKYAWGLTGAPTPNEPTDAFGQVRLITPENVTYSFKAFKESTMRQLTQFRWVARPEANDIVFAAMQPSVRYTREDCFDLPPTTYSDRDVPLTPGAQAAYKKMLKELAVMVEGNEIIAANEGVKLFKLLQISSGFAYGQDGKAHYIGGVNRIREVFDVVEQAEGKVIVFAPFRFLVDLLEAALKRRYDVAKIHGKVAKSTRNQIFMDFQRSENIRVLVAHPATMSHGLTLTKASTIVWFAPITSLEVYEQANARITRAGQGMNTHIIHITSSPIEGKVYARLRKKASMQGALLELFKTV